MLMISSSNTLCMRIYICELLRRCRLFFLLSCVYQNIYIYRNPRGLISMRVVSVCFCCLILPYSILFYMYKYIWMMMYSFIYQQNTLYVYEILLSAKVTCFNTYNSLKYVLFTKYFFFLLLLLLFIYVLLIFGVLFINIVLLPHILCCYNTLHSTLV